MTKSFAGLCLSLCISCTSLAYADASNLSKTLSNSVSISGQMTTEKFNILLKQGFKSVIVNRPDSESGNQVSIEQLRNIAEKSHVSVIYQPVNPGQINQAEITEFAKYYNSLPKPILLVCKTGTRSAMLFNQAKSQGLLNE